MINLKFWHHREKFLLLEILPNAITARFLSLDQDKNLRLEKFLAHVTPQWLAGYFKIHRTKENIIVAADPSLVVTAVVPVRLDRANRREELTAVELENLLSQAVGRIFNQCRTEASKELGVDDLDTLLVNSQVINFKVDGHHVLNPIGFEAERIEAVLELTLTTRAVFERMRALLQSRRTFFFTEMGRSALASLRKVERLPLGVIMFGIPVSRYFVMHKAAVGYLVQRGIVRWRADAPVLAVREEFGITERAARHMYREYLERKLSRNATRHIAKIMKAVIQKLADEIRASRLRSVLYAYAGDRLPFELPARVGGLTIAEPPLEAVIAKLGVHADETGWRMPRAQIAQHLAPFLEFYYHKNDTQINQWLKRHLNWLGASV